MQTVQPESNTYSLSNQLRESTMSAHKNAEGASFIKDFFTGRCSEDSYIKYLWAFKNIYTALEKALIANANNPSLNLINFPEIYRTNSLNSDLTAWNNENEVVISETLRKAASTYINRIENLAASKPELLVAHSYVRYLGDLSGGQMMYKALTRTNPKENGYSFYQFNNIDADSMKTLYRQRLDAIGYLNPQAIKAICSEARLVFELNNDLFKALGS